jgi:hypothetical protein
MKKRRKPRIIRIRKRWAINPKTRVKETAKIYKRAREKTAAGELYEG